MRAMPAAFMRAAASGVTSVPLGDMTVRRPASRGGLGDVEDVGAHAAVRRR